MTYRLVRIYVVWPIDAFRGRYGYFELRTGEDYCRTVSFKCHN